MPNPDDGLGYFSGVTEDSGGAGSGFRVGGGEQVVSNSQTGNMTGIGFRIGERVTLF
jgi:hypothetical protein